MAQNHCYAARVVAARGGEHTFVPTKREGCKKRRGKGESACVHACACVLKKERGWGGRKDAEGGGERGEREREREKERENRNYTQSEHVCACVPTKRGRWRRVYWPPPAS